ncbi:Uncharacterised protein [uncultured archaeon]|nr:Uncharacterised protein [uncultured archaeon]
MQRANRNKGQAAVEVLAYASFFLLAFVATMAVFFQMQSQELSRAEHAYAQEVAYQFADYVHTAFVAGPGFVQNVTLAPDILGKPYTISVSQKVATSATSAAERETGFAYVDWQGPSGLSTYSAPTITAAYAATESSCIKVDTTTSFIRMNCTKIEMRNINGTIYIRGVLS